MSKTTVKGDVIAPSESAQEIEATRYSDAEILAVQRKQSLNLIWERTQQGLAILCVTAAVLSSVFLVVFSGDPYAERGYQFLTNIGLLVIGFYFGRTNHARPTGEKRE